jgi:hypothetical protein
MKESGSGLLSSEILSKSSSPSSSLKVAKASSFE